MILDSTLKLEAVLAGAVSTTQPIVHVDYIIWNSEGVPTKPLPFRTQLNSTTDVTILAAPMTQGNVIEPLRVEIYNADSASATVIVKTDDGSIERIKRRNTLLTLETLCWERGRGWYALDANGNLKETISTTFSSLSVTGNTTLGDAAADSLTINGKTYSAPNIPAFLVYANADITNVTGNGTLYTVAFNTEVFDQGGDFASNTFTAPQTGRYLLSAHVGLSDLSAAMTLIQAQIVTSNRTYQVTWQPDAPIAGGRWACPICVVADMDTADTAVVKVTVQNGAGDTADLNGGSTMISFFSGHLVA